ncbi:MAG TPA: hypothetical protein QF764_12660 [Planctomycetota bacterium]|jgi:antitoxin component YwqK of YwqJK toxin-antitoxin module|nr:hypothetical protein [Planctomycetota bacterium]
MRRRRARFGALAVLSAGALAACAGPITQSDMEAAFGEAPGAFPRLESFSREHATTGMVVHRWGERVLDDGTRTRHGRETRWHPDGTLRSERVFECGEPVGTWRSWHPDGHLRSLHVFSGEGAATPMGFWHPDGSAAAAGAARRGLREGLWTFWYPDGTRREEGRFAANRREGLWTLWNEDGSLRSRGAFEAGVRVGDWEQGDQ